MSPDNKEIALVHLAQDIPQRILHLDDWEFIRFVHGSNERNQTDCKIYFLVRRPREVRLMMIKLDPWKRIDRNEPFLEPESIFRFEGNVTLPNKEHENLLPKFFSDDKIKNIHLLENEVDKCNQVVLSI